MTPTFEDLVPGTVFTYYDPRSGILRQRGVSFGRILAKEAEHAIVHVRTLRSRLEREEIEVDVGFLPLTFKIFLSSLHEIHGVGAVPDTFWQALAEWREAWRTDSATAFSVPLWEAVSMAWETVTSQDPSAHPENTYIEAAYPIRCASSGRFTVVWTVLTRQGAA